VLGPSVTSPPARGDFCEGHARAAVQAMRSKKSASGRTDTHRKHIPRVTGFRVQARARAQWATRKNPTSGGSRPGETHTETDRFWTSRAGVPTNRSKNCAVRGSGSGLCPRGQRVSVRLFGRVAAAIGRGRRLNRGLSAAYRRLTAGACLWPLCRSPTAVLGVRPPDNPTG